MKIRRSDNHKANLAAVAARGAGPVVLAGLALALSACGGAPPPPGVASVGSSSTTTTTSPASAESSPSSPGVSARLLEFAHCMRAHGVTTFPDLTPPRPPTGGRNSFLGNGPNPNSPAYQAASAACRKYALATRVTAAGAAAVAAEQLRYVRCMRAEKEPDFPDPNASGGFTIPKTIDQNSAAFRTAERACEDLQPGFAGPPGTVK